MMAEDEHPDTVRPDERFPRTLRANVHPPAWCNPVPPAATRSSSSARGRAA